MQGIIHNYRRGVRTVNMKQFIVIPEGIDSKAKASKLSGKTIVWKGKNSNAIGKILAPHGDKGAVRARFESGLPGQAIGTKAEIKE